MHKRTVAKALRGLPKFSSTGSGRLCPGFRAQYLGLTSSPYDVIALSERVPTSMSPKQ
jgi:hypothetical protein